MRTKISSLSSDWVKLDDEYDAVVYGIKSPSTRPEDCFKTVDSAMKMALSNLYVKKFF